MSTVTTIRILFIATGILFLVIDFLVYVRKKLTTGIGLTWGLFSIAMILAGVYPGPVRIALNYIIALVFVGGLLFLFLVFRVSMLLSELKMRNQELAMQVSLLNQENEQILNKMGMLLNEEKILFVINTLGAAGAERALLTLLKKLDPGKYEIALYVLLGQGELAEELPPYVHLKNRDYCDTSVLDKSGTRHMVKTVLKAMFRRGTVFVQFPYLCRNLFAMLKCKKVRPDKLLWRVLSDGGERFAEEYDLAVAFLEGGATYYVADHVKAKKKAAFVHIDYTRAGYTRRLDKDCYQKFDAIFPIGENVKKQFLAVYPEYKGRTRIFHNQIDQSELVRRSKLAGGFTDTFDGIRILTVGRLTAQKAHSVAVETLALLKEEKGIPPVRWYILGEGPERQHLERQIAKAGLTEDFILPGAVENPCPYYVQTDLYVHITAYEGKSIAIQEAQTLGCAIIASENNWEQIDDGNDGVLCRCTAKDAKDAILYLIQHSEKREQLRQNVKKRTIEYEDDMELLYALL